MARANNAFLAAVLLCAAAVHAQEAWVEPEANLFGASPVFGHAMVQNAKKDGWWSFFGSPDSSSGSDRVVRFDIVDDIHYAPTAFEYPNAGALLGARVHAAAARDEESIFVYGGAGGVGSLPTDAALYKLNVSSLEWSTPGTTGSDFPPPLTEHTMYLDSFGPKLFIYGGKDGTDTLNGDVFVLNLDTWAWGTKVSDPLLGARSGHCHVPAPSQSIIMFGHNGTAFTNDMFQFDTSAAFASSLFFSGDPPSPRAFAACVSVGSSSTYVFGGENEFGLVPAELFKFDGSFWSQISPGLEGLTAAPLSHSMMGAVALATGSGYSAFFYGGKDGVGTPVSHAVMLATSATNFDCSNFEIEVYENAFSAYVQCTFDQAWHLSEPLARHTALCNCTESLVAAVDNYLDMYPSCSAAQRFRARYSAHLDRSSCRTIPNECIELYAGGDNLYNTCQNGTLCDCVDTQRNNLGMVAPWDTGNYGSCNADDVSYFANDLFGQCGFFSGSEGGEPEPGLCYISGTDAVAACQGSRPPAMAFTCTDAELPRQSCPDGQIHDGTACVDVCLQ